jgi:putative oxidoreductase
MANNSGAGSAMLVIARTCIAILFLVSGIRKAMTFAASVGYMTKNGVPEAEYLLIAALVIEIGGGLLLILGWKTRYIATALLIFVAIITPLFHAFWAVDASQYAAQLNNFLKNLAVIGGLLYVAVFGAGAHSVDGAWGHGSRRRHV